jgi:hypothetical protein
MRIFVIMAAIAALAALPCAWDSNPRELTPLAAIINHHV